jgi:glyoxylase-like metal-dependent hydrolase (beta-lactamase superfamily II)
MWPTPAGGPIGSWIHEGDRSAAPWASGVITGEHEIQPGFVAIPVPGHTKGSTVFLLDDRWLFTGDSLAWSNERDDLVAFRSACWFSWRQQTESLTRLADRHRFSTVLPGHGARRVGDADDLHDRLVRLVALGQTSQSPANPLTTVREPRATDRCVKFQDVGDVAEQIARTSTWEFWWD